MIIIIPLIPDFVYICVCDYLGMFACMYANKSVYTQNLYR